MNATLVRNPIALGIAALLALILATSSFVIVPETEQAVILRFEQPVYTVNVWKPDQPFGRTGAGLLAKFPFIDKVVWVDKRVLDVDLENQQVLSTDQLRLEVDAFARFRIINPLKAVVSTGSTSATEDRIAEQLRPLLGSALRNELGKRPFAALLSPERGQVMDNIQNGLQKLASQYGVQIVDVRIKHADLPSGSPLDSALNRMRTARQQQAATIRAQGQKSAQIIRAEADANASRIYAESFNKDADFYDFYRAMQSYRQTFAADGSTPQSETSIILSPNNEYLKQFTGRPR
ncbi:protease modulator HflC [Sphingomonas sp. 28-63-12]|uniref:protease modulator HflC n=1 Tax=Sphingomonas sp. 28-63-12 TaxID=1970434 RepID=UPI000BCFAAA1|nr:MAG: protease modulator HflC [Sphingomonas sp. 28-63-12]